MNELEIVRCGGLEPIVAGTIVAAEGLDMGGDRQTDKELPLLNGISY